MIVVPSDGQTERTLILTADHGDGEQRGLLDEHLIHQIASTRKINHFTWNLTPAIKLLFNTSKPG
jgi:hypothetical protein